MPKIDENGVKPTSGQAEATLKNFTCPRQCLKSSDGAQKGGMNPTLAAVNDEYMSQYEA